MTDRSSDSSENLSGARAQLAALQRLLDEVQRVARLGYWTLDLESWQFDWSEGAFQIWGRDPELGSPTYREYLDTLPREDRAVLRRAGERAVESGETFEVEHRILHSDDEVRWVRLQGDVRADLGQMVGVVQDVTEQRQLELQLRQAQKMEAVGQLAGGVAHDFNNLLTVILSFTDLARERIGFDHPADADLREVIAAAERAEELTAQLLAFSRRKAVYPEVLDANASLERLERMLRRVLGADVEYRSELCDGTATIEIDKGAFEQVLLNLVVNARDAMPGGGELIIRTSREQIGAHWSATLSDFVQPGGYVAIAVTDTGSGIDPAHVERIFEPFFTTKKAGAGTGLGLSTCLGIVQQAGGHVVVDSAPGEGTTFTVLLPQRDLVQRPTDEVRRAGRLSGTERILVAEDNDQVRELTLKVLDRYGYQAVGAVSAHEALELLAASTEPFDLLLTDVVMPQMNGRQLADRVLDQYPGTRVLFMSGYTGDAIADRGVLEYGVHLLEKPFTPERLLAAVRATLDSSPANLY